jgi:CheY-like chemotaxis protein
MSHTISRYVYETMTIFIYYILIFAIFGYFFQLRMICFIIDGFLNDVCAQTPLHGFTMCMDHVLQDTTEHMADGKEKDDIIEQLQMCKTNCAFMSVAINRTVDFAKSTSDIALTPKIEPVSISDSMQWAVTCLKAFRPNVSITVVPLPDDVCDVIVTDKHWLMENVLCYLSNAVKYSANGHVTVSASLLDCENGLKPQSSTRKKCGAGGSRRKSYSFRTLEVHPESGVARSIVEVGCNSSEGEIVSSASPCQMLCISVDDEGIGISDDKKSSLFKPFQQTMRLAGGTGLGLYSLSKRVEVLKGSFGVEDRTDGRQGSRFWFSIPYLPDEESTDMVMSLKHSDSSVDNCSFYVPSTGGSGEGVGSLSALIVEDSIVISKSTKRMLEKSGYKVDVAENGAIGLEKMKAKVYSVVIMDLQMPVMDGLEATRRMRLLEGDKEFQASGKRQQFIIGSSANGADDVMKEAMDSGMDMFVEKPFSMSTLTQCQQKLMLSVSEDLV